MNELSVTQPVYLIICELSYKALSLGYDKITANCFNALSLNINDLNDNEDEQRMVVINQEIFTPIIATTINEVLQGLEDEQKFPTPVLTTKIFSEILIRLGCKIENIINSKKEVANYANANISI